MAANGGSAQRISFGEGSYSTPVWSPRDALNKDPSQKISKPMIFRRKE
jgi:hypothetical protein